MKKNNLPAMKRKSIVYIYIIALPLFIFGNSKAQTEGKNNLGNEDITIVKEYQPVLNDAFKMNILPEGDTSTSAPAEMQYKTEPVQMNSMYSITPIKPVKIKDDAIKKLYRAFVKAGYGNYNTPLLEFSYHSIRSKLFDAGVQAKHLSSTGNIKGYGNPDYSINQLGLNGTRYFQNNAVNGELNYSRNLYHFYGYQSPPELFTKSETRHLINLVTGKFGFYSTTTDKDKLAYNAGIGFSSYGDNLESNESLINFNAGGGKRYNDSYISGNVELDATNITQPRQDNSRTVFRAMPRYAFKKDKYFLTAGANLAYESGDNMDTKLHLYPHMEARFQLLKDEINVYGQLTGNLHTNTLVALSQENQFLSNLTPLVNTNEKINFTAGMNAKISKEFITVASFSFCHIANQPYFINLIKPKDPVKYGVFYDDLNQLNLHVEMNYIQENKLGLGIAADYYSYNNDSLEKPLFKPAYRIGITGNYNIADKIFLKADIFYNAATYAFNYSGTDSHYIKLKDYADINFGAEYRYSKILSAFVQLNNLGMQKYFRWYNYPSYRLNVMAGVTYSFW